MNKSEFLYRFIDECMYPYCLDIILKENYDVLDNSKVYVSLVEQFQMALDLFEKNEKEGGTEKEQNEKMETFLALVRQKVLLKIKKDVEEMFKGVELPKNFNHILLEANLDAGFFLKLVRELREQEK